MSKLEAGITVVGSGYVWLMPILGVAVGVKGFIARQRVKKREYSSSGKSHG